MRRSSSSTARASMAWSGLRQALLARRDMFVSTMAEKMLTYALGRGLEYYDMPVGARGRARRRTTGLPVLVAGVWVS